jgi:hypothetical protein
VTIAASLYVSGTLRGAEIELFLASLGLGSLDLKLPRFFVQTPRKRRGSFFTGSWSALCAHRGFTEPRPIAASPFANVGVTNQHSINKALVTSKKYKMRGGGGT